MGSKNRIAKYILPIILDGRKRGQWYVEPFVGGANIIDKVCGKRIGADSNEHVISLFQGIQNGFIPPDIVSEKQYNRVRRERSVDPLTAFIGLGCSYGGKWWGGYARSNANNGNPRNHCSESKRNILKQSPSLQGVKFVHSKYRDLILPPNSIIYCDPPYAGATKYVCDDFDHDEFWQWCRDMQGEGHQVFVSEYAAPDDFECLWSKPIVSSLTKNTGAKIGVECLFKVCTRIRRRRNRCKNQ